MGIIVCELRGVRISELEVSTTRSRRVAGRPSLWSYPTPCLGFRVQEIGHGTGPNGVEGQVPALNKQLLELDLLGEGSSGPVFGLHKTVQSRHRKLNWQNTSRNPIDSLISDSI